jgi:hypothetical protein
VSSDSVASEIVRASQAGEKTFCLFVGNKVRWDFKTERERASPEPTIDLEPTAIAVLLFDGLVLTEVACQISPGSLRCWSTICFRIAVAIPMLVASPLSTQ